jgi:hypothetical protein
LPNDHVRTIIELLRSTGPDLGRRWLAALTLVDPDEREEMVETIERRIAELYAPDDIALGDELDETMPTIEVKVKADRDARSDQSQRSGCSEVKRDSERL